MGDRVKFAHTTENKFYILEWDNENHIFGEFWRGDKLIEGKKFNACYCGIAESDVEENPRAIEFFIGDIQASPQGEGLGALMLYYGLRIGEEAGATRMYVSGGVNKSFWDGVFEKKEAITAGLPPAKKNGDYYGRLNLILEGCKESLIKAGWNQHGTTVTDDTRSGIAVVNNTATKGCGCVLF